MSLKGWARFLMRVAEIVLADCCADARQIVGIHWHIVVAACFLEKCVTLTPRA